MSTHSIAFFEKFNALIAFIYSKSAVLLGCEISTPQIHISNNCVGLYNNRQNTCLGVTSIHVYPSGLCLRVDSVHWCPLICIVNMLIEIWRPKDFSGGVV
jgi:hypothetical protein